MKDGVYIDSLAVKIIDIETVFNNIIEKEVEEDDYKFRLQKKPSLIKKFITYRFCNYILRAIQSNNNGKMVLYFNENIKLNFLLEYVLYIKLLSQQLSRILSFTVYYNSLSINDLHTLLLTATGESKEIRLKISSLMYRSKNVPNITKFNKFLEKNGIHRIDNNPAENYKIRLGLFIA